MPRRAFHHIQSHVFREKKFSLHWQKPDSKSHGQCDHRDSVGKRMFIAPNLSELELLETALHEPLHACYPDLDEDSVDVGAADMARFLWRMGFRLTK